MLLTPICLLAEIPNRFKCTGVEYDPIYNVYNVLCECKYCGKEYVRYKIAKPEAILDGYISPTTFEALANSEYKRPKRGIQWI